MVFRGSSDDDQRMLRMWSGDVQTVFRRCSDDCQGMLRGVQMMHRLSSDVAQMVLMMLRGFSDNALSVLRG